MKVFSVLASLALASSAAAAAIDTSAAIPELTERACGETGTPCTTGDDCCVYCSPSSWTCTHQTSFCVEKGLVPILGRKGCCTKQVDSEGKCT